LSDPAQLDAIRADRSLLPQAIEEGVRWEPPLLTITRVATRDTELGGVQIPAGATVMPMLGSANRQEDRYRIQTRSTSSVRPGKCWLGVRRARLSRHASRAPRDADRDQPAADRLPNLRMDPDGDDRAFRGQVFRSPTSLPVLFDPA
jgi:hypothetical protein